MGKVRNDPSKYARRSDLLPKRKTEELYRANGAGEFAKRDFLTAPIDERFYIDFGKQPKADNRN